MNAGQPLPNKLKSEASRTTRGSRNAFAVPIVTVLAYYAIDVGTFSGGDHTSFFALAAALVAGLW